MLRDNCNRGSLAKANMKLNAMTTSPDSATPQEGSDKIYAIAERQPEFPCWCYYHGDNQAGNLYAYWTRYERRGHMIMDTTGDDRGYVSHWSPDQPEAPTATPQDSAPAGLGSYHGKEPVEETGNFKAPAYPQGQAQQVPEWISKVALIAFPKPPADNPWGDIHADARNGLIELIWAHAPSQPTEAGELREAAQDAVKAMDALIIFGEQHVEAPYKPLKERFARDRLKTALSAPPAPAGEATDTKI